MSNLTSLLPSNMQLRLTLLFFLLGTALTALIGGYWYFALEPRLLTDAQASAGAIAQSHSNNLSEALTEAIVTESPHALIETVDEILLLTDLGTGLPFVIALDVIVDYDSTPVARGSLDLHRGAACEHCFVTKIPLFAHNGSELLGIATFHSSSAFFEQVREEVRSRLLLVFGTALALLSFGWYFVLGLFRQVRASEEAASRAMRARSEFLATMSHEIRTPMNGVMGMVSLLRQTRLTKKQREYLDAVGVSADALLVLLDDILDLSKIEAGKLTLETEPCEIRKLLQDIQMLLSTRAKEKGLELRLKVDDTVPKRLLGDAVRLRQIMLNLIGNALKFTTQGSVTIELRLLGTDPTTGMLRLEFSVIDTGIGLTPEQKERLFQNFSQADSSITRKYGGTGLGLAICRRLVEAMGGNISVESEPQRGSRFYFEISAAVAQDHDVSAVNEEPEEYEIHPLRVLLAEDGEINRRIAKALLEREGHEVIEVTDGHEAVQRLMQQPVDIILMDLQMPVMDGLEATRCIRALPDPILSRVPIVALTANALKEEQETAFEAGMDAFITKPFRPEQLRNVLAQICATKTAAKDTPVHSP